MGLHFSRGKSTANKQLKKKKSSRLGGCISQGSPEKLAHNTVETS